MYWTNWDADVFSSTAPLGGSFSTPRDLRLGNDALGASAVVTAAGAAALVAVGNRGDGGPIGLRVRSSAAGDWRSPVVLSPTALPPAALALDSSGRLIVSWVEPTTKTQTGPYGQLLLKIATGGSTGHVGTPTTLATVGGDCWMHRCLHGGQPTVAIGANGQALVAWVARTDPSKAAGIVMVTSLNLSRTSAH